MELQQLRLQLEVQQKMISDYEKEKVRSNSVVVFCTRVGGGGAAIKIFILFYNLHFLTPWLQYFDGSSVAEPKPVGARTFWTKPV